MATITTDSTNYTAIANAIRSKNGTENKYKPYEMANAISNIKNNSFAETQTYSQINPIVNSFLTEVVYDPSDYSVSRITEYAGETTSYCKDQPSGLDVPASSGEICITDSSINRSFSETVKNNTYTIYNVTPSKNGGTYILSDNGELKSGGRILPTGSLRMIKCPSAHNVRDLGGWTCDGGTVKYGKLFRGGEVSLQDRTVLVEFLGIKHDINLRGKVEATWTVSPLGENVKFNIYDDYAWYSISNSELLKNILEDIFDCVVNDEPAYFHCSAGADRTGTIALILEAILGMNQSDIDKDYELTCFYSGVNNDNNARRRNENDWIGLINSFSNYHGETLRDKVINWILTLGISIETINDFRSKMIDGTPNVLSFSGNTYSISANIDSVSLNNSETDVKQYSSYETEITPNEGYIISGVSVLMDGEDITSSVFKGNKTNFNFSVKNNLIDCSTNNRRKTVIANQSYVELITPNLGYSLNDAVINITMGGINVNNYYSDGKIVIPKVTGNIEISITAQESASENLITFSECVAYNPDLTIVNESTGDFEKDIENEILITKRLRHTRSLIWSAQTLQSLPPGKYRYSGEFKQDTSGVSAIAIYANNINNRLFKESLSVGDVWTQFSYDFEIANESKIYFCAQNDDSGYAYLRNAKIIEI